MYGPPVLVKQHGLPPQYRQYPIWQDRKPHEELYDIRRDPEAIHNLAGDPAYSDIREELRDKLFGWMIETADMGLIEETEIVVRWGCTATTLRGSWKPPIRPGLERRAERGSTLIGRPEQRGALLGGYRPLFLRF